MDQWVKDLSEPKMTAKCLLGTNELKVDLSQRHEGVFYESWGPMS